MIFCNLQAKAQSIVTDDYSGFEDSVWVLANKALCNFPIFVYFLAILLPTGTDNLPKVWMLSSS
jgi:hypothetical protein